MAVLLLAVDASKLEMPALQSLQYIIITVRLFDLIIDLLMTLIGLSNTGCGTEHNF